MPLVSIFDPDRSLIHFQVLFSRLSYLIIQSKVAIFTELKHFPFTFSPIFFTLIKLKCEDINIYSFYYHIIGETR